MKESTPLIQMAAQQMLAAGMTLHQGSGLLEKAMIKESLRTNRGNVCRTAKALQVHRNTLGRKMMDLEIADVARECRADLKNARELRFGGHMPMRKIEARRPSADTGDRSRVA